LWSAIISLLPWESTGGENVLFAFIVFLVDKRVPVAINATLATFACACCCFEGSRERNATLATFECWASQVLVMSH
jgi:hypothetical protein